MTQNERSKELLLSILKPCFFDFDEWPAELIETAISQNMDASETLENVFRFRSLLLNFLEMCPYQLIDRIYFGQIITAVCDSVGSLHSSTVATLARCILQNGQLALFVQSRFGAPIAGEAGAGDDASAELTDKQTELLTNLRDKCSIT